jgi:predicted dehydrogenase
VRHGGYNIVAAADYFHDKVNSFGEELNVAPGNRYATLSCYKKLLEQKDVDAVAIESPPYFHPLQAASAVDAAKHVFIAKPVAVDVPGCRSIDKSAQDAKTRRLCFIVDFQTRANKFYIEAIKRIHEDRAIGCFAFGQASYHTGGTWGRQEEYLREDPKNPENRLRAWGLDRVLSGDIITEQNIHAIDVASWVMNTEPVYAAGTGGRKVRSHNGDTWDHFALVFEYPNNVGVTFSSRQFQGHGAIGGINNRMFGSKGVLETQYGGRVLIRGENFYPGGETGNIYEEGACSNIATFHDNIRESNFENQTARESVRSNLVTILGRTAAYTQEKVYWKKLIKCDQVLEADLTGLKL